MRAITAVFAYATSPRSLAIQRGVIVVSESVLWEEVRVGRWRRVVWE